MSSNLDLWKPYQNNPGSTVTGDLRVLEHFYSPQLGNRRDLLVWLPPTYFASKRRYPVLYMHDGQNVFDTLTSFAGEWGVDESMTQLTDEGVEAIVVALPSIDGHPFGVRQEEYSPFIGEGGRGGRGDAYLAFLVESVKARVDTDFRTLPTPAYTGIAGSSLGGFISLYTLYARPATFGFAGAFSPYLQFSEEIFSISERPLETPATVYLDVGTKETGDGEGDAKYVASVGRMAVLLERKGMKLKLVVEENGQHNEAAWGRRFPAAARWLLPQAAGG